MFCKLVKSKMYLVGTFTMAVILYVSTGIQFWLTKYFIEVLNFEEHDVFIAYAVVSFTGPTTGCAFGISLFTQVATWSVALGDTTTPKPSTMSSSSQSSALVLLSSSPSWTVSSLLLLSYGWSSFSEELWCRGWLESWWCQCLPTCELLGIQLVK